VNFDAYPDDDGLNESPELAATPDTTRRRHLPEAEVVGVENELGTDQATDAILMERVRAGDRDSFTALYSRYAEFAVRVTRRAGLSHSDADDVVAEVFTRLFSKLIDGGGPDQKFGGYLAQSIRNAATDRHRSQKRLSVQGDMELFVEPELFHDPVLQRTEASFAAAAFRSLPDSWQKVLWRTEIERQSPREVGQELGVSANSISALKVRAREGLRQAYLQAHLGSQSDPACVQPVRLLGRWVRGALHHRDAAVVAAHLTECDRCQELAAELSETNGELRGLPLILIPFRSRWRAGPRTMRSRALRGGRTRVVSPGRRLVDHLVGHFKPSRLLRAPVGSIKLVPIASALLTASVVAVVGVVAAHAVSRKGHAPQDHASVAAVRGPQPTQTQASPEAPANVAVRGASQSSTAKVATHSVAAPPARADHKQAARSPTSNVAVSGTSGGTLDDQYSEAILQAINSSRAGAGLTALVSSPALRLAAKQHNNAMASANVMSHDVGTPLRTRISALSVGENIAWTSVMSEIGALTQEANMINERPPDDPHRVNILKAVYRQVGIDVYLDNVHRKLWLTEDFAA
jgi:RNA polymerase sigma factor (sigma-70 family)